MKDICFEISMMQSTPPTIRGTQKSLAICSVMGCQSFELLCLAFFAERISPAEIAETKTSKAINTRSYKGELVIINLPSNTKCATTAPMIANVPANTPESPLIDKNLLDRSIMERMCFISSKFASIFSLL